VTAADAGASVRCACGAAVEVPPLHVLRSATGTDSRPPLVRLQAASLAGRLPGTTVCACCRNRPGAIVRVAVECERTPSEGTPSAADRAGCLLGLLLGGFVGPVLTGVQAAVNREGDVTAVTVPLPVCPACRPGLDETALSFALRRIPEYADVLDHYPRARLAVAG
jgi:hypothetical protein